MSHRKFEKPRSGNLGYLPRKRCRRIQGKVKSFPVEDAKAQPHLTAFLGYKVGHTHTVRDLDRLGSKRHKKEICEQVTLLETPEMVVVGVIGYKESIKGLVAHKTVWASTIAESFKRKFTKKFYKSRQNAFSKYDSSKIEENLKELSEVSSIIRVIAHTQPSKIPVLGRKKAHVMEIQVNGGSVSEKVDFAKQLLEQKVSVSSVFKKDELIDAIGITKGKGFKGVISRWGVTKLPRKTHKGLRKVACIGSWHPARVAYTIARAGQKGYHHRTAWNKKVFMVGKDATTEEGQNAGSTEFDLTKKGINCVGGFPNYGFIKNEFLMIKGSVMGPVRSVVTLRKSLVPKTTRKAREVIKLKFIDTASKQGKGRFQTIAEKRAFMGPLKKEIEQKREEELKRLAEERKAEEERQRLAKEKALAEKEKNAGKETKKKKKKKGKKKKKKKAKTSE